MTLQLGFSRVVCLYRCLGSRTSLPSPPHHRGVPRVVENFTESGSAQLVVLPDHISQGMPGGRDYLDSELVHGILSPLEELGRDSDSLSSKVLLARVANQKVWVSVNS
ncbi:hypothetical protein BHE74_00030806 [Ensete ventricosum]|nr:hypothetical protein BHE74_00030806 [Ensete ventricosum]